MTTPGTGVGGAARVMLLQAVRGLVAEARAARSVLTAGAPERQFYLGVEAAAEEVLHSQLGCISRGAVARSPAVGLPGRLRADRHPPRAGFDLSGATAASSATRPPFVGLGDAAREAILASTRNTSRDDTTCSSPTTAMWRTSLRAQHRGDRYPPRLTATSTRAEGRCRAMASSTTARYLLAGDATDTTPDQRSTSSALPPWFHSTRPRSAAHPPAARTRSLP
jgi:hypothetical protein